MDNARVGGHWASGYVYVNGFYEAARALSKSALGGNAPDLLVYPICFNFRQSVERHLKLMIVEAEALHAALKDAGKSVADLPAKTKRLMGSHSLSALLEWVEGALAVFSSERMEPLVRASILEFDELDPNGEAFRYEAYQNGSPTLPNEALVDLRNLMERFERVRFLLLGIDMWMGYHRELPHEWRHPEASPPDSS